MAAPINLRDAAREHMPVLPQLEHLYPSAVATWHARMVNEYTSAKVFDGLAVQIEAAGLSADLAEKCREFAGEERRHGVLCGAVVEALGGEAVAPWPERAVFPFHSDVEPVEALVRNLISISCTSETVAVALIGAERLEMPEGPLRELLSTIYADEVGHARFGWDLVARLVPTLTPEAHQRLSVYLAVALAHLEEHELAHLPLNQAPPPEGAALGLCSGRDARQLLYETIEQVIVPGLAAAGLQAEKAWEMRHRAREFGTADSPSAHP